MKRRSIGWCAAALCMMAAGCAEDVSTAELTRLSAAATKPKQEEKPAADNSVPTPEPEPSDAQDAGNADAAAGSTNSGYGGYGAVGPGAPQDETYGQGAPIKLKSEVDSDLAKAEGGVGKRGQGYGGGIITEPIRQRFVLEDRIKFMNMQHTLQFYKAAHNDQNPPTIQEFVDQIIKETGITLQELPPGHFYVYDPSAKNLDDVLLVDQSQNQQQ